MDQPFIDAAAEIVEGTAPVLITCEHASREVPSPLTTTPEDEAILSTHWGWDIGAAALSRALCQRLGAFAVLARFSRLVCDANREVDDATWIMGEVEGYRPTFNRRVSSEERARRRDAYHVPFHATVDAALGVLGPETFLLAVHSFTPEYLGARRDMEIGVLFERHGELAQGLHQAFLDQGFASALNEPYSGLTGGMYSASRHGRGHGVRYLELEVRQDLLADDLAIAQMAAQVTQALGRAGLIP